MEEILINSIRSYLNISKNILLKSITNLILSECDRVVNVTLGDIFSITFDICDTKCIYTFIYNTHKLTIDNRIRHLYMYKAKYTTSIADQIRRLIFN